MGKLCKFFICVSHFLWFKKFLIETGYTVSLLWKENAVKHVIGFHSPVFRALIDGEILVSILYDWFLKTIKKLLIGSSWTDWAHHRQKFTVQGVCFFFSEDQSPCFMSRQTQNLSKKYCRILVSTLLLWTLINSLYGNMPLICACSCCLDTIL